MIDLQGLPLGVDGRYNVLELEPLADLEALAQDVDMTLNGPNRMTVTLPTAMGSF